MLRALLAPLLPAATSAAIAVAIWRRAAGDERFRVRGSMLKTAVVVGLIVTAIAESLSLFGALRAGPIAVAWTVALAGAWRAAVGAPASGTAPAIHVWRAARRDLPTRVALASAAVFVGATLVVALVAPPNSWDAMTYHMVRVVHWLANGSVQPYPAGDTRQLFPPPLNSYAMLQLQALAGTDRFANLVQWSAYVGMAAAAALATARLGAGFRAQSIAALLALTIPTATVQAATTLSDVLNAFWIVALVAFLVDRPSWSNAMWIGATIGLGMLSKLNFALYAVPIVVIFAIREIAGPARTADTIRRFLLSAAIAIALMAPHARRNLETFGSAVSREESTRNANQSPGFRALASNVLRDTVLNLPIPGYGPAVIRLHRFFGLDPDDPRTTHLYDTTFTDVARRWILPLTPTESDAGNPLHLLAAAAFVVAVPFRRRHDAPARTAITIALTAFAGWLLAQTPFKWQPSPRFDLPFFAVMTIPIATAAAALPSRAAVVVVAAFVAGALPALLIGIHRPLVDVTALAAWPGARWLALATVAAALGIVGTRTHRLRAVTIALVIVGVVDGGAQVAARVLSRAADVPPMSVWTADRETMLFRMNRPLRLPYERATACVLASGCDAIGLELQRDAWEYPLWWLLGAAAGRGPHVRDVGVRNESAALRADGGEPCAVISTVPDSALDHVPGWSRQTIAEVPLVVVYRHEMWAATPCR